MPTPAGIKCPPAFPHFSCSTNQPPEASEPAKSEELPDETALLEAEELLCARLETAELAEESTGPDDAELLEELSSSSSESTSEDEDAGRLDAADELSSGSEASCAGVSAAFIATEITSIAFLSCRSYSMRS